MRTDKSGSRLRTRHPLQQDTFCPSLSDAHRPACIVVTKIVTLPWFDSTTSVDVGDWNDRDRTKTF